MALVIKHFQYLPGILFPHWAGRNRGTTSLDFGGRVPCGETFWNYFQRSNKIGLKVVNKVLNMEMLISNRLQDLYLRPGGQLENWLFADDEVIDNGEANASNIIYESIMRPFKKNRIFKAKP